MQDQSDQSQAAKQILEAAVAAHGKGDLGRVEVLCRGLLRRQPRQPLALLLLGAVLGQTGRFDEAIPTLRLASEAAPDNPDASYNLGLALIASGRWDDARGVFAAIVDRWPAHPFAHTNLGIALTQLGEKAAARQAFETAVAVNPVHLDGHINLILCLLSLGKASQALPACDRLLARDDGNARCHILKSQALIKLGRFNAALESCLKACERAPGNRDCLMALGEIYQELGRPEDAVGAYRRGLATGQGVAGFHHAIGMACRDAGRFEEAAAAFRAALSADPEHVASLYFLATMKRFHPGDSEIERMEEALTGLAPDTVARSQVCFALAKALEDAGDFDRAFECYREGNRIQRRLFDPQLEKRAAAYRALRRGFTSDRLQAAAVPAPSAAMPIFIIGMPRSGTSLLEQILASHPAATPGGELPLLRDLAIDRIDDVPAGLATAGMDSLAAIGTAYLAGVQDLLGPVPCFTDKMPSNFELAGLIAAALPQARIVHCRRDPLDTCLSCFRIDFAGRQRFSNDLRDLGTAYCLYEALMRHWRETLPPGRMIEVAYEDMVAAPEAEIRRLLTFCGLDWDARCLDFHKSDAVVRTASATQVRRPLYATAVGRHRAYDAHLKPLKDALARAGSQG